MKAAKHVAAIAAGAMISVALASTVSAGDYKADPKTFATNYEHITIAPEWTGEDKLQLKLPKNFRRWVFIGAPLTPHGLNGGRANFPEFHNVYVQPEAFQHYRDHGVWPEGTIMFKELQLVDSHGMPGEQADGSRFEPSGRGYFPGKVNGADAAVKDSTRFPESKNWGYFNFGHHEEPYMAVAEAKPIAACAACHIANADEDMVYMKLYRPLVTPLKRTDN
ncbi:MAG: cytochrome P460 family protein [Chromatiales bacterium]|nr:cytochrome P460 family protein [Chromatiales bacterium]